MSPTSFPLGANYQGEQQASFLVWAPKASKVELHFTAPRERTIPLRRVEKGYYEALVEGIEPGAAYYFRLDGAEARPDPASRFQPEGVHGASRLVDPYFAWSDQAWFGLSLRDYILYELHVGTFTPEGTFDAIIPRLPELKELGITAVELMPLAQFPGERNWGYDGVYPFAVQSSYGGPEGLKRLVNACHQAGLTVVLDVVYNHLGPEGNYLNEFGPYFTDRYRTPWGSALNFDGEQSDEVRRFFLENALYWQTEFHIDALRLDAVHAIKDFSAVPFLQELARQTHRRAEELNRRFYLIAESDLNDARLILPEALGGYGLDVQWSDDFHHCLHVLLTGEQDGYYADFAPGAQSGARGEGRGERRSSGGLPQPSTLDPLCAPGSVKLFAKVWQEGWAYTGQYSRFRRRRHGNSPRLNPARQFVVFSQNHDQVGNRLQGERLTRLATLEELKLAAGSVLLSPFIPLLFMGEEYGEPAPFHYVISHTDPELVEAVRRGRREEFAGFDWQGEVPDPQAEATFRQCVLNRELCRTEAHHRALYAFYCELIRLRKALPAIAEADKDSLEIQALEPEQALRVIYCPRRFPERREGEGRGSRGEGGPAAAVVSLAPRPSPLASSAFRDAPGPVSLIFCFAEEPVAPALELPAGGWKKLLDSAAECWGGPGSRVPERLTIPTRVTAQAVERRSPTRREGDRMDRAGSETGAPLPEQCPGRVTLELGPRSLLIFQQIRGG